MSFCGQICSPLHQLRYDIGFFVANDGGNALTGQCVRDFLTPPTQHIDAPYNPTSGIGPYLNADGNACGDIETAITHV